MITSRQKKGVILGIIWSFIAWVPYYTEHLSRVRAFIGVPAALGLNLELALNLGDAFVFSILLGAGMGFFAASLIDFLFANIKIVGLLSPKKKKFLKRGL